MKLIEPASSKLFALIYGTSGTGKTHLAATYGEVHPNDPILLVDVDQGSETLMMPDLQKIDNVFVVSFDSFEDLDQVFTLCEKNDVDTWIRAIPGLQGHLTKPFKCIIWDTWSEVQWTMQAKLRKTNGLQGKGLSFRSNIQLQHWGQMTDLNKLAVSEFKKLPMDCIFLMQAEAKEDAVTGQMIKGPSIHGKLVNELPAMFTTVIYTYNDPKGAFFATTLPRLGWPAKIRGVEGKNVENPRMKDLLK